MAVIPGVSNNELIRTSWGTAVAQELNANSVRRNGLNAAGTAAEQMTGPLILPTTQSTNPNAAVHKTYVDSTFVNVTGDTMTGALILPATQSTNANAAVHKTYADSKIAEAGGTMTGDLELGGGGGPGFSGGHLFTTGHVETTVNANVSNVALNKIGAAVASGGSFMLFEKGTAGGSTVNVVGSITMNAGLNGININGAVVTLAADHPLRATLDADDMATALHMLADRVVTLEARLAALEAA